VYVFGTSRQSTIARIKRVPAQSRSKSFIASVCPCVRSLP
jgi:hypothetical protein